MVIPLITLITKKTDNLANIVLGPKTLHTAPDRAASRSSILNVAFFGAMTQLRGTPLTQRRLFWLEEFLFSSEALNFRVPLS